MHFEKALNNFIAEIKQYHGYEAKIKSMELSEDLYRRLEFELREKSLWQPEIPEPRVIQFYSHGDMIRFHKTKPQPEKPKRTIAEVIPNAQGTVLVKSNDGKLYLIHGFDPNGLPQWLPYPDLPQD
jgi:hypothetical protein